VVIDVLRATSVIVHALSQGALEVIPVRTAEEAFQRAKTFSRDNTLLGGERESNRIEGFDLGNSPREYTCERVVGTRLILTTTNGTRAFDSVSSGGRVLVASFLNISAVAKRCIEMNQDLLIYPSGDEGNFSLEDAVCGGMLIDRILTKEDKTVRLTDASQCAHILYQKFQNNVVETFTLSRHGRDLIDQKFEEDLGYCAQIDTVNTVPVFKDGVIRIS
jgi:2-phosphosulfolactate phosphatase